MPAVNRLHYTGSYQRDAARIRAAAYANPDTKCWRCGKTRAEHGRKWQAGHLIDGLAGGPLAAECQLCNGRAGQALAIKRKRPLQTSRDW